MLDKDTTALCSWEDSINSVQFSRLIFLKLFYINKQGMKSDWMKRRNHIYVKKRTKKQRSKWRNNDKIM